MQARFPAAPANKTLQLQESDDPAQSQRSEHHEHYKYAFICIRTSHILFLIIRFLKTLQMRPIMAYEELSTCSVWRANYQPNMCLFIDCAS